jgi:hypothetical protein
MYKKPRFKGSTLRPRRLFHRFKSRFSHAFGAGLGEPRRRRKPAFILIMADFPGRDWDDSFVRERRETKNPRRFFGFAV